jgi:hypothetical protein
MVSIIDALVTRNDVIVYVDGHACIIDEFAYTVENVLHTNTMTLKAWRKPRTTKIAEATGGGILLLLKVFWNARSTR